MRSRRSDALRCLVVAILFLSPCTLAGGIKMRSKQCNSHNPLCGANERCYQAEKNVEARCECLRGYELVKGECVLIPTTVSTNATTDKPAVKANTGGSSVAAGLLIPTFLIVAGVLLYFGARRYKWLQRFRQFRQNRYGNVLVTRDDDDDDDDDPPIA